MSPLLCSVLEGISMTTATLYSTHSSSTDNGSSEIMHAGPVVRGMLCMQIYADPEGPGLAGSLMKAVYQEYTDATFMLRVSAPAQHGILGPILHARIGDTINIVLKVPVRPLALVYLHVCTQMKLGHARPARIC